jgi:GTP cyclohydrolase I
MSDHETMTEEIPEQSKEAFESWGDVEKEAKEKFEEFMRTIIPEEEWDEHLERTPERVAESRLSELFAGLYSDPDEHLERTFSAPESGSRDAGFVIVDGIQVQSMCAHHFLPFRGKAHIGYIPDDEVVGLSKLARVTDGYARRPQVQERLTNQIADAVHENLEPIATIVVIEAEHECMSLRGVQEPNTMTRTSALRGKARDEEHIKEEFFDLVGDTA